MRVEGLNRGALDQIRAIGSVPSWDSPDPILTDFLDTLRDGVVVVGADRHIKYVNPSYHAQFGTQPGDIRVGDHISDVLLFLAANGRMGDLGGMSVEDFVAKRLLRWDGQENRIERRRMPSGRILDIYRTLTLNDDMVAVHVDVTETVRVAEQVERQQLYMKSVLENTSDGITLLDRDGNFVMFNNRLLELYDVDPKSVYWGIPYDDMLNQFGDLHRMTPQARAREAARRRKFAFDPEITTARRHLGDGRTLNINKTNLPGGGSVMTIRDMTEELAREEELVKARRQAERNSRHKSEFVARMSHEMRTPLNGILGVAALLERTEMDARQHDLVDVISQSGLVLLRLIDDILDLSRMDADTFEMVDERFDIGAVIEQCMATIGPGADEEGLELRFSGVPQGVPELRGDAIRIKQILLNLLTNAVKFTERGHVEVGLEADQGPEGVTLTITVDDTGVGIAEDKLGQIFDRFYQIDGTVTRKHGGAGLGLAITQRLVDLMGGAIQVTSREGEGTTFIVRLTFQPAIRKRRS